MRTYITQMLEEINADVTNIRKYSGDAALKIIFEYAFDPTKKFILPDGDPPYKESAEPLGMSPTNLFNELRRLYIFCREDLTPLKRESLFISLLEGVHPNEAKLLLAIKDQKLTKMYPKITANFVVENGFTVNIPFKEKKTAKKVKAGAPQ